MLKLLLVLLVTLALGYILYRKYKMHCPYARFEKQQHSDSMCCGESGLEKEDLAVPEKQSDKVQ